MTFTLVPAIHAPHLLDRPLQWSLDLWGEGKEEFTAEDWHAFYARVQQSNYEIWNQATDNKELLFLAVDELNEVIATIGLCDFDDLEEFRHLKPWFCAFIVREDLRGSGIGSEVLNQMELKAMEFGITKAYLWTEDQMSFYAKRGYDEISQLHKPGRTLYIMEKELRVSD
jgi:N-acetylglutamate synthase-like GNAT family acetyltransferase